MARRRRYIGGGFCQDDVKSRPARRKPPKSLLIVTEGRNTEPSYFRALKDAWNVHPKLLSIEPGGEGIPAKLVERADRELEDLRRKAKRQELAYNELDRFDEVWIVFDTEHAQRQGRLQDGVDAANARGFHIAHTTPCFEFWLALHFASSAPPMDTCGEAVVHLESVGQLSRGSYSKTAGPALAFVQGLIGSVPDAVRRAYDLARSQTEDTFPANPSTSVQELVRSIHESLPEDLKRRFPLD
jgi:hypothetical protein